MPAERMKLVFAGTPEFALPALRACLASDADVVAVYTQPDRPAGRHRKPRPSPVKQAALDAEATIEQPESLKCPDVQQRLREYAPDLLVVAAYGLILPRAVLAMPRLGCWNLHASLLPRWRGAAPIQRAILGGDAQTGVCLMQMQAGVDTGPVLLREATPIHAGDTGGTLHDRLARVAARVLGDALQRVVGGETLPETPQPETGVTWAPKLGKAEASLDCTQPVAHLARKVRAFNPWPVAETTLAGERVRVWAAVAVPSPESRVPSPGCIVAASKHGIDVACSDGVLRIVKLQRAGGRVICAVDYLNARPGLRR